MYFKKDRIPAGVVMSATEEGNHYYQQYVPDLFVHGCYNKEVVEKIINSQKEKLIKFSKDKVKPIFILLDDCMYDRSFLKDECIRQLFMNGRHWKVFFLLTAQYCMDLPPGLRTNVDYVFVLRENVIQNREKLFKSFFGVFPNFPMFQQVMDACTENYECLVIDNTSKSNHINECVFYYKAKMRPPFRMGSPQWWSYHQRHYDPKYNLKTHIPDMKRRGPTVHVKKE
jgi:hypothetical protein